MSELYLRTKELARRWKVSEQHLRRLRMQGKGPAFTRPCGNVLYLLSEVERYEAEKMVVTER